METKSFFGEQGLTSTSANHYCNLAKEYARRVQNYLDSIKFFSTDMHIIGDDVKTQVSKGLSPLDFVHIQDGLRAISQCNSLIAFFREAIKEKERLTKEAENWEDKERYEDYNARRAAHQALLPVRERFVEENDVIETWTVGEQEKYLSLGAEASVYGKFIHEDGRFSKARRELMTIVNNPNSIKENGRDTIIYSFTPTTDQQEVDDLYFDLQTHYREVQAELNGMKKRIEDEIQARNAEINEKFRTAYAQWSSEANAFDRERQMLINDDNKKRQEMLKEVQDLKIVVPNRLKLIFATLQKLG